MAVRGWLTKILQQHVRIRNGASSGGMGGGGYHDYMNNVRLDDIDILLIKF